MTTIEEFIAGLPPGRQELAGLYLPVLTRWVGEAGWDMVRKTLYVSSQLSWYKALRKRMTPTERMTDDRRAYEWVKAMGGQKAERVRKERAAVQLILTQLLSALLAKA